MQAAVVSVRNSGWRAAVRVAFGTGCEDEASRSFWTDVVQ